ncbi:hypothetical protein BDA96_04G036000 [Sorghum bicolor]|uniref:Uncharacterized protein n=1 Tax=Sorghum bicolor TaxID=4558 RepID=A0A921UJ16_SORBI|nr:hypothetical protein BDA96_04G036000 [Sorghum bicolor]
MLIGTWGWLLYLSTEPLLCIANDEELKACFSTFAVAA